MIRNPIYGKIINVPNHQPANKTEQEWYFDDMKNLFGRGKKGTCFFARMENLGFESKLLASKRQKPGGFYRY